MCIVCNAGPNGFYFTSHFESSQREMMGATKSMLLCATTADTKENRERYDKIHKQMVRLTKEWNKIEHLRELSET